MIWTRVRNTNGHIKLDLDLKSKKRSLGLSAHQELEIKKD